MRVLRWAGRFWTGVLVMIVLLAGLLLGLRLLLPLFAAPPALLAATPADGDAGVAPRARLTLRFDGPMNPRSVERAVALRPAAAWQPIWSDDRATLTISPTQSLRPDTSYTLTLDTLALSRRFRALAQPVEIHFRTAPAPAVARVLPADGAADVPLDTPISIHFSRTIVPAGALMRPAGLPELRFDPPLDGSVTWLDQATALFRPSTPLSPGTLYRATLDATLSDSAGVQLNRPFSWSFSTPAPSVLEIAPADGAAAVAPRATLAITLSQPLDRDSLRASLLITPEADGDLAITDLPDGRQLALFAPFAGWQPGTSYAVTVRAGAVSASGNLPLLAPRSWSFTTAPQPSLTGRFPGEGQTLPPGQEVRLIFNTPIDADAIRAALQLTPTADILRVSTSENEVRIAADVRAATPYTITLPATLIDRNGIPLGQEYRLRFVSAPSGAALALPEARAHLAQALPGQLASLLIQRTNLSALNFDLYQLDESAIVRTAGFREGDWALFQPERYGQPLLRSWSVSLADPLNQMVEERLPLADNAGAPLPAGAYYLRIRTPEGPRADLLALISRARLTLQSSAPPANTAGVAALVWATDIISGTPIGGLPVALYQSGTLIELSTTDASGVASFTRTGSAAQPDLVALADAGRSGVVSSAWGDAALSSRQRPSLFLTTDRAAYRPGERVELAGIVRASGAPSATLGLAQAATVSIRVRVPGATGQIYQEELSVRDTGVFSAGLALSPDAPPGLYSASATINGASVQAAFMVQRDARPPLEIAIDTPDTPPVAGDPAPVAIAVHTPEGLPVAGATISWTLEAARVPFPALGDYTFGDLEREPAEVAARTGAGQTGRDGRFSLVVTDTLAADLPLYYRLTANATEPGGPSASAQAMFLAAPAPIYAGVRLPSRIFAANAGQIELLATNPAGAPAPRASLLVEVYRRTWQRDEEPGPDGRPRAVWRPIDRLAFTRAAETGADGTVSLPLTLPSSGAYRLHVGGAADIDRAYSATTIWATAPGFTSWGDLPGDQPLLIADRATYRPGETATLLLTAPFPQSPVLITRAAADGLSGQARTIRAGVPFTLTIRPEDAPALTLAALFAGRPPLGAAAAPPPPLGATATLPVRDDRNELAVGLVADRESYAPGDTATLTVTTTDASGAGVPADTIISIAGSSAAPQNTIAIAAHAGAAPALAIAPRPNIAAPSRLEMPTARAVPDPSPAPSAYWSSALRTSASGVLTLTIQLPSEPSELRAIVWAAGSASAGQAQATLPITRPFELRAEAPPRFRAGDVVELSARVQSASPDVQAIQASVSAAGIRLLDNAALSQQATLAPGATARFSWRAEVLDADGVSLTVGARAPAAPAQQAQIERPILPAGVVDERNGGALVENQHTEVLTASLEPGGASQLTIELAGSSAALAHGAARALAATPQRSLLDQASLLMIAAPLSDTQALARDALDRLLLEQNSDGGWGWWPGGRSDPFVTAVALEALAYASQAKIEVPQAVIDRAIALLEQALDAPAASADERAHILYALSLHSQADAAALRDLAGDPASLSPSGLAFVLLARPPAADASSLLDRLTALAQRAGGSASWAARRDTMPIESDASATGIALLALPREDQLIEATRQWLAGAVYDDAYAQARALAALRETDRPAAAQPSANFSITLNDSKLIDLPIGEVLTATRTLRVPREQLRERNQLDIVGSGRLFFRYRLVSAPAVAPHDGGIALMRDYLDPLTSQPLDPTRLRAGQLVRARLTVVTAEPRRFVAIADPLPANAVVISMGAPAGFEYAGFANDRITLASATLGPGIYQYSYLLRVVAGGRYAVPPPIARAAGGASGAGNTMALDVAAR